MRGPFHRSRRLRFELSLTPAVVVSLGILVVSFLLYQQQRRTLEMCLGMSLQNVAETAVSFVDGALYARAGDASRSSEEAQNLRRVLERVKAENPMTVEVYTLDPLPADCSRVSVAAGGGGTRMGEHGLWLAHGARAAVMPSRRSPGTHIVHTLHATIHALPPSFRFIPIVIE